MITVSGLEKKLNRVSRQLQAVIQFLVLITVLVGVAQAFYNSFSQDQAVQEILTPTPVPTPVSSPQVLGANLEQAIVQRVVDGDTIRLGDGRTVRYIGIDTPETVAPNKPVECFGKEASEFNRQLIEGKAVWLEKDVSETDRYGRFLRYVYLDPEASLSAQVNYLLVEQGYAQPSSYPPDIKWQSTYQNAAQQARENSVGLWRECISSENAL